MDIASVRILRMAFGTALSLWFSQAVGWQMSFVAPIFTMLVLSLPFPAPGLKSGIKFVLALLISVYAGLALLPLLLNQRWVGILLLTLAVFYSFYYTARGGNAVVGTFATVGIGLATAVGTVSIDGALAVVGGLGITAVCGILFVWIAHAILPDSMAAPVSEPGTATPPTPPTPPKPDLAAARRSAFRSLAIVMPVLLWFLLSSASASYLAVMIKVASMGQQAEADQTKQVGKSLLVSTIIGGIGAIIGWQVLSMWPSLLMYTLLLALAGLVMGRKIFAGRGMHPAAGTWSYGYLTMVIILAPAVLDGTSGSAADAAFWSRLSMFFYATIYGIVAVSVFDAFWPRKESEIK
jgi:hypothetical protein